MSSDAYRVSQLNAAYPEDELRATVCFSIIVRHSFTLHSRPESMFSDEFDYTGYSGLVEIVVPDEKFEVERDLLLDDDRGRSILEEKLSDIHASFQTFIVYRILSFQHFMIDKILSLAQSMANDEVYKSRKVMRMCVDITIAIDEPHTLSTVFNPQAPEAEPVTVPASKSAIEKLEVIEIEDESVGACVCAVCLEEILVGSQGTVMPCSHRFHGDCIVNWLNKNRICPMCRFELL